MHETVDERNGYQPTILMPNVGFTFSPEGRGLLKRQVDLRAKKMSSAPVGPDLAASFILYGEVGPLIPPPDKESEPVRVLADHHAMTTRKGPWFACLSAANLSLGRCTRNLKPTTSGPVATLITSLSKQAGSVTALTSTRATSPCNTA